MTVHQQTFASSTTIQIGKERVYKESLVLKGGSALRCHAVTYNVFCTVVLCGPLLASLSRTFLSLYGSRDTSFSPAGQKRTGDGDKEESLLISCTKGSRSGVTILRVAGSQVEDVTLFLRENLGDLDGAISGDLFEEMTLPHIHREDLTRIHPSSSDYPIWQMLPHAKGDSLYAADLISSPLHLRDVCRYFDGNLSSSFSSERKHYSCSPKEISGIKVESSVTPCPDFLIWQLIDSKLPTGGFAYSCGIEAASQLGIIRRSDVKSLEFYVLGLLQQAASSDLPFVSASHRYGSHSVTPRDTPFQREKLITLHDSFLLLDREYSVTIANDVTRFASISQGISLLASAQYAFSFLQSPLFILEKGIESTKSKDGPHQGHLAPIFGVLCGLLGVTMEKSCEMFLFCFLRNALLSAVRLNLIGPLASETIQFRMSQLIPQLVSHYSNLASHQSHQIGPLFSLVEGYHNRLYSRVFAS